MEDILTICVCRIKPASIQHLTTISELANSPHHNIDSLLNLRLQFPHITHAEEGIERRATDLMSIMVNGGKHAMVQPKRFCEPCVFATFAAGGGGGVYFIIEVRVGAVEFPGGDADYGTVFFVEGDYFEGVLAAEDQIVVEFVPGKC